MIPLAPGSKLQNTKELVIALNGGNIKPKRKKRKNRRKP